LQKKTASRFAIVDCQLSIGNLPIHRQALDAAVPDVCRHGAVTIGNFDGVHLGHQTLVAEAARQSRMRSGPCVAVTFDPHPQQLLRPAAFQPILTTLEHRAELLGNCGADHVIVMEITTAFLQLSAREFFERLIHAGLAARAVVEGFNFGFGRAREGTTDVLRGLCQSAGIDVTLLPAREWAGKPVSTSRVRAELTAGNVAAARALLGRPYRLSGTVGTGQKRGQKLGFPTANLERVATLIPGDGVYAVRAGHRHQSWPAAANVGPNPTFGEHARKIEVHLIGFNGDLYNETLSVDFLERIRDTRAFAGPAELAAQLCRDVEQARQALAAP
jgi:riboflavin kinase/FMN adenylyltransferase